MLQTRIPSPHPALYAVRDESVRVTLMTLISHERPNGRSAPIWQELDSALVTARLEPARTFEGPVQLEIRFYNSRLQIEPIRIDQVQAAFLLLRCASDFRVRLAIAGEAADQALLVDSEDLKPLVEDAFERLSRHARAMAR